MEVQTTVLRLEPPCDRATHSLHNMCSDVVRYCECEIRVAEFFIIVVSIAASSPSRRANHPCLQCHCGKIPDFGMYARSSGWTAYSGHGIRLWQGSPAGATVATPSDKLCRGQFLAHAHERLIGFQKLVCTHVLKVEYVLTSGKSKAETPIDAREANIHGPNGSSED